MDDINRFLARCRRDPAAVSPVKLAWRAFNDSLPVGRRGAWSRDAFLGEMIRANFQIGELEGRAYVCGLSLAGAAWRVENGQVRLSGVA